jgi:hypothetical protein
MNAAEKAKFTRLKRDISAGIDDLAKGRFKTYDDSNYMQLAREVSRSGRARLNALRLKVAGKTQKSALPTRNVE